MISKKEITLKNMFYYIQGNIRYILYYSKFKFLIPKYIREQIDFRIRVMDKKCYNQGSCKMCGCKTTALQMSNKTCNKPCYPPMMNKKQWKQFFKENNHVNINNDNWFFVKGRNNNYKLFLNYKLIN